VLAHTNTDGAERSEQWISPVDVIVTEMNPEALPISLGILKEEVGQLVEVKYRRVQRENQVF
jgi:hypothetical protein